MGFQISVLSGETVIVLYIEFLYFLYLIEGVTFLFIFLGRELKVLRYKALNHVSTIIYYTHKPKYNLNNSKILSISLIVKGISFYDSEYIFCMNKFYQEYYLG